MRPASISGQAHLAQRVVNAAPVFLPPGVIFGKEGGNYPFFDLIGELRIRQPGLILDLLLSIASQCQTRNHSHSIINCPPKSSDDAGFPVPVHLDTMKNTMKNTMMNNSRLIT